MKKFFKLHLLAQDRVMLNDPKVMLIKVPLYIYIYMVFTTEGFLEVAIESWPKWDLNPRPLNSVQTL